MRNISAVPFQGAPRQWPRGMVSIAHGASVKYQPCIEVIMLLYVSTPAESVSKKTTLLGLKNEGIYKDFTTFYKNSL